MSKHPYYLGISIGPIYDTLSRARKTRELWAGSYLFSRLMKALLQAVAEEGADAGCQVLSPVPVTDPEQPIFGAGIYPDRLFVGMSKADQELPAKLKQAALKHLLPEIRGKQRYEGYSGNGDDVRYQADLESFWNKFFRIVHVMISQQELVKATPEGASPNVLKILNERLDTQELSPVFFRDAPDADGILHLLEKPYQTKMAREALLEGTAYSGLVGKSSSLEFFPSTADIASLELFQRKPEAYQQLREQAAENVRKAQAEKDKALQDDDLDGLHLREFYRLLFETSDHAFAGLAQPHHRYFCIVHADGDSFGDVIAELKDDKSTDEDMTVTEFSQKVADFAVTASATINRFGGKPIYIGGDDLVFFAPVVSLVEDERRSVFDLITALDRDFLALGLPANPSMSYGVSIAYYKFPLFEARDLSYGQLEYRAKKAKWATQGKKNTVGFRLLKHSGSYFEGILPKEPLLAGFNHLADQFMNGRKTEGEEQPEPATKPAKLLSSFAFKLRELEVLVAESATAPERVTPDGEPEDNALTNLFKNYFNEPIHRRYKREKDMLETFTRHAYGTAGAVDGVPVEATDNFYALLRLLDFLTPKKKDNV